MRCEERWRRASKPRRQVFTRAIAAATAEATALGLSNARFEVLDVETLDEVAAYDLVTAFDAIHDQAHPAQVLAAVARALRDAGFTNIAFAEVEADPINSYFVCRK